MLASWVSEEVKDVDLGDKRLNERMGQILDQLGGHPTTSIPAACGGCAETVAAYRFFDNEKVSFENILQPHIEATYERMAQQSVVILAQDTTEIDLTRPTRQVVGAGPLDDGARFGEMLHPLIGFTSDGTPLGTVYAETWVREDTSPKHITKAEQAYQRKHTPIEEKESMRWVETLVQAQSAAEYAPETQFVCVADSEADIYELLQESQKEPQRVDWIVRACQNRALQKDQEQGETATNHLRERVLAEQALFTQTITIRGRKAKVSCKTRGRQQPRESRTAEVEVRAARVTLRAPWRHDRKLCDVTINAVLVSEVNPPKGDVPIEWLLLTNLPIADAEQVRTVIQYYTIRWMIEVFFRTLKSGCRVEDRQFEHIDRLTNYLAICLIVTWRTLMVCRLGREFPEISCEAVFEAAEWKSVYQVIRNEPPPKQPPSLQEMIRMVAQLGGYVNRSRSDEPGPQTVWLGLQRTHDIACCWRLFGPEARKESTCV